MDDWIFETVAQQHTLDDFLEQRQQNPESASSNILQLLPVRASFDRGYYITLRAIQDLRAKKNGAVFVGIGGPSGSGKTSLADRLASFFSGIIISMEDYQDPSLAADDNNEVDFMDFPLLIQHLQDLVQGIDIKMPHFDFQEKRRAGYKQVEPPKSGVIIIDGTYALHSKLRAYLDLRVAVVGGIHFSLISKVRMHTGGSLSLDYLIDSIFPTFRKHIEPDLHHAQISISNTFKSSLRTPYYILKMESKFLKKPLDATFSSKTHRKALDMYLMPPSASDQEKITDWIKVRQIGIRYDVGWVDQRIVDKNFIIKPKVEFEVGKTTLGGLLALGYEIGASYVRESDIVDNRRVCICMERVDDLEKTFILVKGKDRKVVAAEALSLGMEGPWITKSYLEMVIEVKGVQRRGSPPLPASSIQEPTSPSFLDMGMISPNPVRLRPTTIISSTEPWTRSPTKLDMEASAAYWQVASLQAAAEKRPTEESSRNPAYSINASTLSHGPKFHLLPMPEVFDFDRGLLLAVQGVQTLLNGKGPPVIVGIGGPSGSGKTSLAHKMANIVGCEVISMENYYKAEEAKGFKCDEFTSLDLCLLLKNIKELRVLRNTKIPLFDFEKNIRTQSREINISKDCGVVIIEGVYALHPKIRDSLDLWIAVVGGVHSHLIARVQRDLERSGRPITQQDAMTTVFPMFHQHIEPHLVHAHLKIRNDFDPIYSADNSMFVLKSGKEVATEDILRVLDPDRVTTSVQCFMDIYLHLPGTPSNGLLTESNCIRVRHCEGRFALLIREPIREGNFIVQPRVDFDISVRTVAGLLNLGYEAVAHLEATATSFNDDKLLIEVDHLKDVKTPFIQIKGSNKDAVAAAGSTLNLEGHYTTMPYIEIVFAQKYGAQTESDVRLHDREADELKTWVNFVQSQAGISGSESTASSRVSTEFLIQELEFRVRKLENWNKWHIIHTVLWTSIMSAFVGYIMFQRKHHSTS